jgi:serine/threonine protein kinase
MAKQIEDGQLYAVKAFSKEFLLGQPKGRESIMNELDILIDLDHKNVIKVFEVHESKNSIYVVQEYLSGGSLNDLLKRSTDYISVQEILKIIK